MALAWGATAAATEASCGGLWHSTTTSARWATSAADASASPPTSSASARARSATTSVHSTGRPQPRASPRAMLPAPMRPSTTGSALVEESLFDELRAFLSRDLDVARREHEDLVGDPLHAAIEGVGEPAGEVDEALGEVGLDALQVQDDRDRVLELVRDLLGVVEALGDDEMHAHVAATVPSWAHRAQLRRLPRRHVVVGEDVVELVAAAARAQPADVRALAVAILELGLRLVGIVLLHVWVALLGKAEVHERTVPGIAERHTYSGRLALLADSPATYVYKLVPSRTIVAPSCAATA